MWCPRPHSVCPASWYANVSSTIRVNDELTDPFDLGLELGLRQGCVLSPVLYSLFIDGLRSELARHDDIGIEIGLSRIRLLLYADDIVLLAPNEKVLQRMLDIVTEYARKWRFTFNIHEPPWDDAFKLSYCGGDRFCGGDVARRRSPGGGDSAIA